MIVEGRGQVPPAPVRVRIDPSDVSVLRHESQRRSAHRNYAGSQSTWGRGLTLDPILMGMVGEMAVERFLQGKGIKCKVLDFTLNEGDGGRDAVIASNSYQIKTSAKSYDSCLVRRVRGGGKLEGIVADRFVFCCWGYGEPACEIRGWCTRNTLRKEARLVKSRRGDWFNLEMPVKHLSCVKALADLIKQEVQGV